MTRAALAVWCVLRSASCALLLLLLVLKTVFIFRNTRLLSVCRNVYQYQYALLTVGVYVCTMAGFSRVFVDTAALVLHVFSTSTKYEYRYIIRVSVFYPWYHPVPGTSSSTGSTRYYWHYRWGVNTYQVHNFIKIRTEHRAQRVVLL